MISNNTRFPSHPFATSLAVGLLAACIGAASPAGAQTSKPATTPAAGTGNATPAFAPAAQGDCERYLAVLSGRTQDAKLMKSSEIRGFAQPAPDLVTCGAVRANSEDLCNTLLPDDAGSAPASDFIAEGPYKACREQWATLKELRDHPQGRSFMFNDINMQGCRGIKDLAPLCDGIRDAMRSGDEKKCASLGKFESICRAYIKLDKSLCKGDPNDPYAKNAADDCVRKIERKGVWVQGLTKLAESGSPRERDLAKAALGKADACASLERDAMKACTAVPPVPAAAPAEAAPDGGAPAGGNTPAPTPGAG
jgi:hypothetical protein